MPLSEAVYRIQGPSGSKQRRMIVHFDRLKPCPKGTEFVTLKSKSTTNETDLRSKKSATSNDHQLHQYVAEDVDYDDEAEVGTTRHNPQRVRYAPSRYTDCVPST